MRSISKKELKENTEDRVSGGHYSFPDPSLSHQAETRGLGKTPPDGEELG